MAELARYQVHTPTMYWLGNGLVTAFCVFVMAAIVFVGHVPAMMILLFVASASAAVAFVASMSSYRVGGGRNLIRIYPDRIEVPGVSARPPMVFPREGLVARVIDVQVAYRLLVAKVATLNRGKLVELAAGGQKRKLSTLVLDDPSDERFLLADLGRFLAGEPALGRAAQEAVVAPRTAYDDRLDRELAELE
jgi:hypothetical protein